MLMHQVKFGFGTPSWEILGFQSENEPERDIRGGGMFNLLYLKEFVDGHRSFARDLFNLSKDPQQNFPLALAFFEVCVNCLKRVRDCSFADTLLKVKYINNCLEKSKKGHSNYAEYES